MLSISEAFLHNMKKTADEDFLQSLKDFLVDPAAAPVFNKADGTIDREKTLNLPCYEGFKEKS